MDAVIVTGAAGALGQAVVEDLLGAGTRVVALGRPGERLDALGAREGVHAVPAELSSRAAALAAFEAVDALAVTPTALVGLAGAFAPAKLPDIDEAHLADIWNSNFAALLWTVQAAAPRMAARGGGAVVTVGSKTAVTGPAPIAHATSKAAVVRLTELLADELREQRIRVNAILPSVIDTPANRSWMSPRSAQRAVAPAAIAKVIRFLIGPDSAPISGAAIPVYGDA